eukprot:SAG31_NODE_21337_length_552_cov_0.790287_1_plen_78_part_01
MISAAPVMAPARPPCDRARVRRVQPYILLVVRGTVIQTYTNLVLTDEYSSQRTGHRSACVYGCTPRGTIDARTQAPRR